MGLAHEYAKTQPSVIVPRYSTYMLWTIRVIFLLFVFCVVFWMAEHVIMLHAHVRTAGYDPQTLLAAHTAGLFAGGAATVIMLIAILMFGPKPRP